MVDVCWNACTSQDPLYDDILVRLYVEEPAPLTEIEAAKGYQYLAEALSNEAKHIKNAKYRKYYRDEEPEYGK